MKFVVAPDKYKGSLTGFQFCEAVENGLKMVFAKSEIIKKPLADGGDGTLEVVKEYLDANKETIKVKDPLFREIEASYLLSKHKGIAYIEMSEASGYKLLDKSELNCMDTTTVGTGEMIADALKKGAKEIVLGIGGSATNDAGMGMASALGYVFKDKDGNTLNPIGRNLEKVFRIDGSEALPKLKTAKIKVACDVNNPLYGKNGAAYVYGPQKGASTKEVELLDTGLRNFAEVIREFSDMDMQSISGAGAAGGMGAGAVVFLDAELTSGVDLIMEMAQFQEALQDADWIITGEGQLDGQTLSGKTINGVLKMAKQRNIPVAALCGSVDISVQEMQRLGLSYAVSILNQIGSLEQAKAKSFQNLEQASFNFAQLLKKCQA
ncbi:glycerate kinase [Flagellimonas flava]|uniref:Glycerate kinase n=1 Tax=Flagellimonas flava TaxID=570519 RepID=A0A1M5M7F7_9FLAO|nr:glycerate kinase [Allomuricauda flava]SHG73180.1 glycerate kinase [Allomuricauda flava]